MSPPRRLASALGAAFAFAVALCVGCGASSRAPRSSDDSAAKAAAAADSPRAAEIWRSKCGACHVPVAPGALARDELERALRRHHKRVPLSDAEWAEMLDFLTAPRAVQ